MTFATYCEQTRNVSGSVGVVRTRKSALIVCRHRTAATAPFTNNANDEDVAEFYVENRESMEVFVHVIRSVGFCPDT